MYICIKMNAKLEVKTGMHIGASSEFSEIGAVDSPVIKDPTTGEPIIPGSSLKGKIKTLLARKYNKKLNEEKIKRLFGSCGEISRPSRVIFYDSFITKDNEKGDKLFEVKSENTIDIIKAMATPRQIERVVRGTKFDVNIVYEFYNDNQDLETVMEDLETVMEDLETIMEDLALLIDGINLLENNYLGGNGSRGHGQVEFSIIKGEVVEYSLNGKDLKGDKNEIKKVIEKIVKDERFKNIGKEFKREGEKFKWEK